MGNYSFENESKFRIKIYGIKLYCLEINKTI